MPQFKRQHFVPQFYLRRFSTGGASRVINLFNFETKRFIASASIRKQAAKAYFYGNSCEIEHLLSAQEGEAATIIGNIVRDGFLPQPQTHEYEALVTFILFLWARTEKAADRANTLENSMFHSIASRDSRVSAFHEDYKLVSRAPVLHTLLAVATSIIIAQDLQAVLLENHSRIEFVTSDSPVVFENRFMEKRKVDGSHTGLASIGLRVFFPISPRYLILLYDPGVYLTKKPESNLVHVDSEHDIWGINRLQFVGGHYNAYLPPTVSEPQAQKYYSRSVALREQCRHVVNEYDSPDKPGSLFVVFSRTSPRSRLDLSFMRVPKRALSLKLPDTLAKVRNPELCKMADEASQNVLRKSHKKRHSPNPGTDHDKTSGG